MKLMAAKQQFFVNSYTVNIDNAHIMNLDDPIKNTTLRRYLMSRAPKASVIQRIFVSADKSWKRNEFALVTVKPYAAEAMKALNCMIPECIHLYGVEAAQRWFSNAGLLAYQDVKWDPTKQSTTSHQDKETKALVDEDLFQIGTGLGPRDGEAPTVVGQPQVKGAGRSPDNLRYRATGTMPW
jgi:hypothetical protein